MPMSYQIAWTVYIIVVVLIMSYSTLKLFYGSKVDDFLRKHKIMRTGVLIYAHGGLPFIEYRTIKVRGIPDKKKLLSLAKTQIPYSKTFAISYTSTNDSGDIYTLYDESLNVFYIKVYSW